MSQFIGDITTNGLEVQRLDVKETIVCKAIEISGAVFNGDVSGGVTLPFLESNYIKKSDASALAELSSTATEVILGKTLNAPSVSTGKVFAGDVYSNMLNPTGISLVNIDYATNAFPLKSSVYTKTQSDAITSLKLGIDSFTSFQQTNAQNLQNKADVGASYLKSQSDNFLAGKVDNSALGSYQASVTTLLAGKQNVGDAYTKAQVDNIVSGKLDKAYSVTNDASVASKVSQFTFDNFVQSTNSQLAAKGDVQNVYSKTEANALLAQKVGNDFFQTFSSANSNALNTKVSQTSFDSFVSSNTNALNNKVSSTEFGQFQTQNTAALQTKYNVSDFNTFSVNNNTALSNRLLISDFNLFKGANDTALGNKVNQSDYNTYVSSTATLIGTKANTADIYNKTQTDAKDTVIQNSLDSYKSSNNTAVATKLDSSVFNTYKTSNDALVTDNFSNLQGQITARLKITDFDSYRQSTSALINTKQDIIPYAFNQSLTTTDSPTFTQVSVAASPATSTSLVNKVYVDSVGSASVIAGVGLTKASDNTLSVNPIQSQITQLGTLANLNVSGNIVNGNYVILPYNNGIESLRFTRRDGSYDQHLIGTDPNASRPQFNIKNLSGSGIIQISTAANGLINFEGGTVNINNTNDSTASSNGSLKVLGGVGIAKSLYVGGTSNLNNLNVSGTTLFNTLRVDGPANSIGLSIGGAGTVSIDYPNQTGGRMTMDAEGNLNLSRGILTISNTSDSASATSGSLRLNGGLGVAKSVYIASNLTAFGTSAFNILNVTGPSTLNSVSVTGTLTQDIFTRSVVSNVNTANRSFARALAFQSTNAQVDFDTFELRNASGAPVFRSQFGNGATNFKSSIYTAEGSVGLGSTANGSTIESGVVGVMSCFGTGYTASLDFLMYQTGNDKLFKWYKAGSAGAANPLMYLSSDGSLTTGNYSTGTVSNATTQAGVTFTKTTDAVNWSKTGRIAEIYYQFVISAQSGTQTGALSFTLPIAAAITYTMDSGYFLYRNGAQATNVRLNFTQGATNVTVTMNNGFGAYNAFALTNTENFNLMFQYPTI